MTPITCSCGWVHLGVTREFAQSAVMEFNEYYYTLDQEKQAQFGSGARMADYEYCCRCGAPHTEARPSTDQELESIYGSTIGPMIWEE